MASRKYDLSNMEATNKVDPSRKEPRKPRLELHDVKVYHWGLLSEVTYTLFYTAINPFKPYTPASSH